MAGIEPTPTRSGPGRAGSIILPCGCQCCVILLAASSNTGPVHGKLADNCIARQAIHKKGVQEEKGLLFEHYYAHYSFFYFDYFENQLHFQMDNNVT
jgi:hypothetical protein